ncbi:MAG: radical SAM protein [Clostridia bacterium]|nr:radical SAM protein [Clostridia bacterium]
MKVLFINPAPKGFTRSVTAPLGLLSIASYLNANGHTAIICDRTVKKTNVKKIIKDFSPDIVGVSVISYKGISDALIVSEQAKEFSLPVVWGGTLFSALPESALESPFVDMVSVGEGEETWLDILNSMESGSDIDNVKGLVYKKDGKVCYTGERPLGDLSSFPSIDYELVDVKSLFQEYYCSDKTLYLFSSKGCPGKCTFCFNPEFHRSTHRRRRTEHIINEICHLRDAYSLNGIYFADELFARNREELTVFCNELKDNIKGVFWGCQMRIGLIDRELLKLMYDAGCRWIFFGVESGSKETLKTIKKGIDYDKISETFRLCKELGIITIAAFIIGFPGETREQIADTVRLASSIDATQIQVNFFAPFAGSEAYNDLVSSGRYVPPLTLKELSRIRPTEVIGNNFSCVSDKELKVIRYSFMWRSLFKKELSTGVKHYEFAFKMITDAVKSLFGHGILQFFGLAFLSAKEFLTALVYAHFFPRIRRKYGLEKGGKK